MARFKRSRLLEHLKNVSFWDASLNITIKFDQNYEVRGMYDIVNFRKQDGVNKYVHVATWDGDVINGNIKSTLEFDKNVKWLKGEINPPASYCSENCSLEQTQEEIPTFDFNCCWKCNTCHKLQIVLNNTCVNGPEGWVPNTNRTGWVKRELVYPKWSDGLSIGFTICSMIALVLTLGVFVMFIVHKDNKLLKASGRELCCVMLVGIGLCFIVPPLFVAKPGTSVCYARNLVTGLALVMCYAPLFLKINRIYRIFTNAKTTTARPALIKPRMQDLEGNSRLLIGITELYGLHQLINEPTRITETSSTMIDHIFTNTPDKIICSGVSHVGISDHSLIYAFRKVSTGLHNKGHSTVNYRKFKNFNLENFRSDIFSQNWDVIRAYNNPNDMWREWKTIFNNVVEMHAPTRTRRVRFSKSPWITPALKRHMHERDILKIKAIQSKDIHDWAAFKKARNSVNSEIKLAKKAYYMNALHENESNVKKTWSIINELTSRKQNDSHVKEIKLNGSSISDPPGLSETFNTHFASIGPKLMEKIPFDENNCSYLEYLSCHTGSNSFELKSTTSSIVCSLLEKLCKSKATGLDKISARLLRCCPDLLSESLTVIFNCSINTGIFPDEWKCSKVIPLFKHGERGDLNNYRPISIIPVVAKVFERIIFDQIYAFLTDSNLLCNSQSGFRCLHSTVTALLESTNSWAYNIDQGRVNAVVFLDLRKAFDTVDHRILLSKLNAYGFGSAVGSWFKSYLSNRSQKCYVNGHLSNNRTLLCGIPQGTILGPLLFLLYINDLPNCLEHSQARMYADDTNLTFASNNIDDINYHLNLDLANVNKWLIANRLTLNQSKTEFMLVGSRQRLATLRSVPCLEIDSVPIDKVSKAKSLGVCLDENLSWNIQINELTKKIASGIGALKRVRSFVPAATLQLIFNSLVQPYFNYCCTVWDNCNKTFAEKLQKLQNRAARVLTFSSYDTNADVLIDKLGWKKLSSQRQFQKAVMVYKSLNGLAPDYMHSMFVNRDSVNPYSLRNTEGKLAVPKPRTNYLRNSFSYSGAVLWNSLPIGLRQANNLTNFRAGCAKLF